MLESLLLGVFSVALLGCVLTDTSILFALTFGLALFSGYALAKGHTMRDVFAMWWSGIHTILPILVTFVLIGCITAFWRAGGTIPAIVAYGAALVSPNVMVLDISYHADGFPFSTSNLKVKYNLDGKEKTFTNRFILSNNLGGRCSTHLRRRLPDNADVGKRPDGVLKRKRSAQLAAPALRVTPIATLMCRYYI